MVLLTLVVIGLVVFVAVCVETFRRMRWIPYEESKPKPKAPGLSSRRIS